MTLIRIAWRQLIWRRGWDRVHMDFGEYNSKHFLVVIDAYSKWPEVRYMSSTSASRLVEILEEIFAFHGFPRLVVSDNGPQFISHELQEYLTAHRILHHRSAPYHPATNGLAEGMVKNVKQWLRKQVSCSSFTSSLANFLRAYRNVPHTSTGHSPAELIFGRMPRTHLSMLLPSTAERVKAGLQPSENLLPPRRFKKGEDVWVRDYRPNAICKWTKAVIESVDGPLNYSVVMDNGHSRRVHVDHIIDRPELPTPNPTTTAASRPPEELRDMIVQDVPRDGNHFPSSPVTPSTTCSADTASSGTVLTPATVIQPQVRRSSRSVKAPKRLIEEM